ncbi:MAG: HD domain-containing phosphohydrolase [Steroidobacteraceae bacterium]
MSINQEVWDSVDPVQVKVGDRIRIDRRWFDHPFERRLFQVDSEREIGLLRNAGLQHVFVARLEQGAPAATPGEAPDAASDLANDAEAVRRAEVAARLAEQREGLAAAHAREVVTRQRAQQIFGLLSASHPDTSQAMALYIDFLVAVLNNSTAPLAPIAPHTPSGSLSRLALLGSDAVWLAGTIGKRMGLARDQLRALVEAAATHRAGLSRLQPYMREENPDADLRGTPIAGYPNYSAMILGQCGGFSMETQRIVREHRERLDGSGFPNGLQGAQIHPHALILGAVCELQSRCASGAVAPAAALATIHKKLRAAYGSEIVNHLVSAVLLVPVGTYVQLSDGSIARVLRINEAARLAPVVESFGPNAQLGTPQTIDLSQRPGLFIVHAVDTSRLPPKLFDLGRTASAAATAPKPAVPEVVAEPAPPPAASQPAAVA